MKKTKKARVVIVNEKQAYVVIDGFFGKRFLWKDMGTSGSPHYSSCTHTKKEAELLCKAYNEIYISIN